MSGAPPRSRWSYFRLRPDWARAVVEDAGVARGDTVLDLGAGDGALTAPLLARGARVLAVEQHRGRAAALRHRFAGRDLVVVEADLRDLRLPARPFRVVANPPFHLARPLVTQLLGADLLLSADLVLRRDTARNIAAARRRHPRFTVDAGRPVPRHAFSPAPSVDALVLQVRRGRARGR
ncbi:methyltransferase domain-containing protein [Georgenia sp. TF02-10]|uniref:rRNA adenine N-6-methyltransferase family protein n=1 Tax=Georgenia sp. TF02-10 TaxID=2917725 RepID=UPI001FA7D084|nr:rRNA adenine N-6-methyltransferase family protein [Georgenia sp. TF02-10]UNX55787.1 methyltransferase domain-containing protein [Georgenia sp. TF02-10]